MGTLAWAHRRQGLLSPADYPRLVGQGVRLQLGMALGTLRRVLGFVPRRLERLASADTELPQSGAVAEAFARASDELDTSLFNHSLRTYVWGVLLAALDEHEYDRELLAVAALLHDLGLAAAGSDDGKQPCFTLVSAAELGSLGAVRAWPAERQARAAEAITIHMNLGVRPKDGVEGYLVNAWAQMDVIGRRYWRFDHGTVSEVLERYPRAHLKRVVATAFAREAHRAPRTRSAFYNRLGLALMVRWAPYAE